MKKVVLLEHGEYDSYSKDLTDVSKQYIHQLANHLASTLAGRTDVTVSGKEHPYTIQTFAILAQYSIASHFAEANYGNTCIVTQAVEYACANNFIYLGSKSDIMANRLNLADFLDRSLQFQFPDIRNKEFDSNPGELLLLDLEKRTAEIFPKIN